MNELLTRLERTALKGSHIVVVVMAESRGNPGKF